MKYTRDDIQEKKEHLNKLLQPGDTIYMNLKHVSKSGMYRAIDFYVIKDNIPLRITYSMCVVAGYKYDRNHEGLGTSGCGMDMGFDAVYNLGYKLYPDGFPCIGQKCRSNDHSNGMPREKQYTKETCPGFPCSDVCDHIGIPDVIHLDGGYAFNYQWM